MVVVYRPDRPVGLLTEGKRTEGIRGYRTVAIRREKGKSHGQREHRTFAWGGPDCQCTQECQGSLSPPKFRVPGEWSVALSPAKVTTQPERCEKHGLFCDSE